MDNVIREQRERMEIVEEELAKVRRKMDRVWHAVESTDLDMADASERILEVENQIGELGKITKWANTIKNNGEHILKSAEKVSTSLAEQINVLNEKVAGLREAVSTENAS